MDARLVFKKCDVSDWDDQALVFDEVYKEFGRLDIVMANAGIPHEISLVAKEDVPSKPSMKSMDVNLSGIIFCKFVLGFMEFIQMCSVRLTTSTSYQACDPLLAKKPTSLRRKIFSQRIHFLHCVLCWNLSLSVSTAIRLCKAWRSWISSISWISTKPTGYSDKCSSTSSHWYV